MNHKILTNQIMPLSALCSLPLPPGNKECLGQITPLHVVTFGAYISLHILCAQVISNSYLKRFVKQILAKGPRYSSISANWQILLWTIVPVYVS
jgi:hypothetical protein